MRDYEWLKNLKPGDKVIIEHHGIGSKTYTYATVDRITPKTKKIKVGSRQFYQDSGREVNYGSGTLLQFNEANRATVKAVARMVEFKNHIYDLNQKRNQYTQEQVDKFLPMIREMVKSFEPVETKQEPELEVEESWQVKKLESLP